MRSDQYDLPLSTASDAARDAYVLGLDRLLTQYDGIGAAFDHREKLRREFRVHQVRDGARGVRRGLSRLSFTERGT